MGILYIVSTPIGNLEDITFRALRILFSVDIIAAEDTRRTGSLMQELEKRYAHNLQAENNQTIRQSGHIYIRYDNHTEIQQTPALIDALKSGKNVALVSDAGTPLISDPGYILVRECRKRSIRIECIPGPTAAIAALTVSGLPANNFLFLGYPPEKSGHRQKLFGELKGQGEKLKTYRPTVIFYCPPHKLDGVLTDLQTVYGDTEITLVRELTKIHEDVVTAKISDLLSHVDRYKGEIVLLLSM